MFHDVIEYLRPLVQRNRVMAAVEGDHEERLRRMCGGSPMALVLGELGAGKLLSDSSALLHVTSGGNKYTIYATHGTGVSRTLGGSANWLERVGSIVPHADVIMAAHMGTPMVFRQDILKINKDKGGNESERHSRLLVSCGSCLARDDDYYHDDSNSLPSSTDYPIISIIPGMAKPTATI